MSETGFSLTLAELKGFADRNIRQMTEEAGHQGFIVVLPLTTSLQTPLKVSVLLNF